LSIDWVRLGIYCGDVISNFDFYFGITSIVVLAIGRCFANRGCAMQSTVYIRSGRAFLVSTDWLSQAASSFLAWGHGSNQTGQASLSNQMGQA